MSITSEQIDYIIKVGVHPVLKQEGYLKSSRTFRRVRVDCIQIINFQGSWTNYTDQGQFTAKLAVYFPEATRTHGSFQITDRPAASDCIINQRIGHLMPAQQDYWWKFDSSSNLDKIAKEVISALLNYGKPWLEEHSTFEGALQFVAKRKMPYWASVFSLMLGKQENARHYLFDAINQSSQNPSLKSRLEDWGRSKGLL